MSQPTREEMLELGRSVGRASSREDCSGIIKGLMETVRAMREDSGGENHTVWMLLAAIEGIRETMPRFAPDEPEKEIK
jgi:hypothetical protein